MPSYKTRAAIQLLAHLPDEDAGRFHITLLRKVGDHVTPIHPSACAILFPELADHVALHGSDSDGVPEKVLDNAWYHCAGIFYPGEAYADHIGQTEAGHRLRRLLRMTGDQYHAFHGELQACVDELDSPRALRARLEEMINLQRLRWKNEASAARVAIERAMESLGADANIEVAA